MKKILVFLKYFFFVGVLSGACMISVVLCRPSIAKISLKLEEATDVSKQKSATLIYDRNGKKIGEFYFQKRIVVRLKDIPEKIIFAFLAAEDERFFEHRGLDPISISRAFVKNLKNKKIVQGGSTITQQVTKMSLLSPEKTYSRKIKEAIYAMIAENTDTVSKEEILETYLNLVFLGRNAYGIVAGAENFFGKKMEDISLEEAIFLASMVKAPSYYSTSRGMEDAKNRARIVLRNMMEANFINEEECAQTDFDKIKLVPRVSRANYFTEYIKAYLISKYGEENVYGGGFAVYTTIDSEIQRTAELAVEDGLQEIEERNSRGNEIQSALISIDLSDNRIIAMVGGRDFYNTQFNRAVQSQRQAGSVFKPFVYASAIERGISPDTLFSDEVEAYRYGNHIWEPKNYNNKYNGMVSMRYALAHSLNVPTVKIAKKTGVKNIIEYSHKMGLQSEIKNNLSISLGSASFSLYELAGAYSVFAKSGIYSKPIFISSIIDRDGNILEKEDFAPIQVISKKTADLVKGMLEEVIDSGTGMGAKELEMESGKTLAGKTGTTDNFHDAWFIGFSDRYLTAVWTGRDDCRSMGSGETGARAALPIWKTFMEELLPKEKFENGVILAKK